jgi:hypothetical protein
MTASLLPAKNAARELEPPPQMAGRHGLITGHPARHAGLDTGRQ